MKKRILIILLVLAAMPMMAKKPMPEKISTEQEQQFTYYWYAARQAINEERYADAYALLEFCHWLKPNDGATLGFLGIIYKSLDQPQQALAAFKEAFEADPRDQWYKYSMALLERRTPDPKEKEQYIQEALPVLERAYKVQKPKKKTKDAPPVDEDLLEQLKRVYINLGKWKQALAMQDELDEQKGYDAWSALTRYRIYAAAGKPKKAIAAIDKYLENDPTDVRFLLFRLELMEYIGVKQTELYATYEKILQLDPYNLMVLNNYAYHLATHGGDLKEAERMSVITIREEPNNPVYLDTYGWILHLQGQNELAKFYLNKALQNGNDSSTIEEIKAHLNAIQ